MPIAPAARTSFTMPGMAVTDHVTTVPLDWGDPDGPTIEVFVREVVDASRARDDLPGLLFLQGGPGGKAPRPGNVPWVRALLAHYRVFLLDQRGTGRSTPVEGRRLTALGGPADQAAYLGHFRGDAIVRDAEHLRATLFGGRRWETLGQSYGGFCTLTYLSLAPEGLAACYVTGGLPSLRPDAAEVYRRTYPRIAAKNQEYYARFPHDVEVVGRIADRLAAGDVVLPDGDPLTVRRLQLLGLEFGRTVGFDLVHWLVDEALASDGEPREGFLAAIQDLTSFADNPLFVVLQESIYGTPESGATAWAAQAARDRHPDFAETARPLLFTGETMFPWMVREIRALQPFRDAVEILAARTDWPPLYDLDVLARNEVPLEAAVYYDDMYVDAHLQLETAAHVGNAHAWVTNEWEHDGLQDPRVIARLRELVAERGGPRR
ncbi:MAG: alpha/beta fold hydrolase [Lapillicoccus sp.]